MTIISEAIAEGSKDPSRKRRATPRWPHQFELRWHRAIKAAIRAVIDADIRRIPLRFDNEEEAREESARREQMVELAILALLPEITRIVDNLTIWQSREFQRQIRTLGGIDFGLAGTQLPENVRRNAIELARAEIRKILAQAAGDFRTIATIAARNKSTQSALRDARREVNKRFRRRMSLLGRNLTGLTLAAINKALAARAGLTKFEWVTMGDERVRPAHVSLDGEVFRFSSPPSEGLPGEPPNCRCTAMPVG